MNKINDKSPVSEKISKQIYAVLGVLISAIAIGHFVLQMTFIDSENQRVIESVGKIEPSVEQFVEIKPQEQSFELSFPKNEIVMSDVVMPDKKVVIQKNIASQKIVYTASRPKSAEVRRQPLTETAPKPVKKKIVRETESKRLRRAEQILTGF